MGDKLSVFPLGSGPGVREMDVAQNSGLRNGFLYGKTNAGTNNAIVTDFAGGNLAAAADWTDIVINRQRMPIPMTPSIFLDNLGATTTTESLQFRMWGENLFGEPIFEESPTMVISVTPTLRSAMIWMSKPFAIITRMQYKHSGGLTWFSASVGAIGMWDRETAAGAGGYTSMAALIGRSHIGIELPMKIEPVQSAQLYSSPQVISVRVSNHTDPGGSFTSANLAELQPTTDEVGSLGGFIIGDKFLNTEAVTGWEGYHNKVRLVRVPGTKTVRADSGATTFRFHTGAGASPTFDLIQYFIEAKSGFGTPRTFALPT